MSWLKPSFFCVTLICPQSWCENRLFFFFLIESRHGLALAASSFILRKSSCRTASFLSALCWLWLYLLWRKTETDSVPGCLDPDTMALHTLINLLCIKLHLIVSVSAALPPLFTGSEDSRLHFLSTVVFSESFNIPIRVHCPPDVTGLARSSFIGRRSS